MPYVARDALTARTQAGTCPLHAGIVSVVTDSSATRVTSKRWARARRAGSSFASWVYPWPYSAEPAKIVMWRKAGHSRPILT
jgi:hypothetical protein